MSEKANVSEPGVHETDAAGRGAGAQEASGAQRDAQRQAALQRDVAMASGMRVLRLLMWSGALVAVAAIVAFVLTGGVSHASKRAPALPKRRLTGPPATLASLKGEPALILFWASWCGGCRKEAAAVRSFAASPVGKGRIVGVDWGDHVKDARRFLRRNRWSFTNLRDKSGEVGLSYGLTKLPALFVIDSKGNISKAISGAQTQRQLRAALLSK